MEFARINPELIGTWFPPGVNWDFKKIKSLATLIKTKGWDSIPRIPVYELPDELKTKHKYLLADGHKRRLIASKLVMQLPCIIYRPDEIIDPEKDHLDLFEFFGKPSGSEHYKEVLALYQDPTIVENWIIRKGKSKWDEDYMKKLIL